MAKKPNPKSSYVVLESARVYYDQNSDTVHLTVKDKEIPEGIHLSLNSGREDERRLRRILDDHGLLNKSDLMKEYGALQKVTKEFTSISRHAHMSRDSENCIPFGFGAEVPMSWNLQKDPHLLVVGCPGSGKSVTLQNIAEYVLSYGNAQNMKLLHVPQELDEWPSFNETLKNIDYAKAIVEERYRAIVDAMANNEEYVPSSKVILLVDNLSYIATRDLEAAKTFLAIVRMGLPVGVHVVAASFGPDAGENLEAAKIMREIHDSFPATFNLRHYTTGGNFSTAEKALFKTLNSGCGLLINSSGKTLVQIVPYRKVMEGKGWFQSQKRVV